jgi:hypothetical protein
MERLKLHTILRGILYLLITMMVISCTHPGTRSPSASTEAKLGKSNTPRQHIGLTHDLKLEHTPDSSPASQPMTNSPLLMSELSYHPQDYSLTQPPSMPSYPPKALDWELASTPPPLGSALLGGMLGSGMVECLLMMMVIKGIFSTSQLAHIFKLGEYIMDLNKTQKVLNDIKSLDVPRWSSSKLWVTVGLIGGLIWLFNSALQLVIWPITILAGGWLVCRTIEGIVENYNKRKVKEIIIASASKNGLTSDEIETILTNSSKPQ